MMVGVSTKKGYVMNVKLLSWRSRDDGREYSASSVYGSFLISCRWERFRVQFIPWDGPNSDSGWFDTIDDAKTAANNKHTEHIMDFVNQWIEKEN